MRNRFVVAFIGCLLLLSILFIGGRLPFFLFYFFIGVLLLPFIHGLRGKHHLKATMTVPGKDLIAGESIDIKTHFHNPSKTLYPHLAFSNTVSMLISDTSIDDVSFHLGPNEQYVDEVKLVCRRRGLYSLGQSHLYIKDIFNLYRFKKTITAPLSLKIYPRLRPLNDFNFLAGIQMGDLIVEDPLFQDYASIDTLRAYRQGDSVKRIHWRASAKQESLMVKEFDYRGDASVKLLIDQELVHYKNDPHRLIEDQLIELALSICHFCLKEQVQTSLILKNEQGYDYIKGSSEDYLKLFLEALVTFKPDSTLSLIDMLKDLRPTIGQGTTLIILSPGVTKALATSLLDLQMHNIRPMLMLINSLTEDTSDYKIELDLLKKLNAEDLPAVKLSMNH